MIHYCPHSEALSLKMILAQTEQWLRTTRPPDLQNGLEKTYCWLLFNFYLGDVLYILLN